MRTHHSRPGLFSPALCRAAWQNVPEKEKGKIKFVRYVEKHAVFGYNSAKGKRDPEKTKLQWKRPNQCFLFFLRLCMLTKHFVCWLHILYVDYTFFASGEIYPFFFSPPAIAGEGRTFLFACGRKKVQTVVRQAALSPPPRGALREMLKKYVRLRNISPPLSRPAAVPSSTSYNSAGSRYYWSCKRPTEAHSDIDDLLL